MQIWADVLGIPQVGIHDDFFELGGHSLLATQLMSRVRDALDVDLQLITLFDHPTVAEFAGDVATAAGETGLSRDYKPPIAASRCRLSFAQQRLWFLDQLEPGNPVYNVPWAMRLDGPLNMQALQASIDDLVNAMKRCAPCSRSRWANHSSACWRRRRCRSKAWTLRVRMTRKSMQRLRALARIPFGLSQTPLMRVHVLHVFPASNTSYCWSSITSFRTAGH